MARHPLVERIGKYLDKQDAWLQEALAGLEGVEEAVSGDGAELDSLLRQKLESNKTLHTLVAEHRGLLREWDQAQDVPEADREWVKQRAASIAARVRELHTRQQSLVALAQSALRESEDALGELNRGRQVIRGYRPGMQEEPGYLDKRS